MKIALIGYGRMGKRIEQLAVEKGHEIQFRISTRNKEEMIHLKDVDVAIEFTEPNAAIDNFKALVEQGIPVVTGTTGWYQQMENVRSLCKEMNGRFFYASNFSPGVFITHYLTAKLAEIMNDFTYSADIEEWHHTGKKDAPSGTAETLAKEIINHNDRYDTYGLNVQEPNAVKIKSHREGDIKGIHCVNFSSRIDRIQIKHEAFSRDGFALGAIMAAEFLITQQPGIYGMNNLIQL